jgi:hypothetical protein
MYLLYRIELHPGHRTVEDEVDKTLKQRSGERRNKGNGGNECPVTLRHTHTIKYCCFYNFCLTYVYNNQINALFILSLLN